MHIYIYILYLLELSDMLNMGIRLFQIKNILFYI